MNDKPILFFWDKEISFKRDSLSYLINFNERTIDFEKTSISFDDVIRKNRDRYTSQINKYLSELNVNNHSLNWWAFNFSAKNSLSASLYYEILDLVAIFDFLEEKKANHVYIKDVDFFTKKTIKKYFKVSHTFLDKLNYKLFFYLKSFYSILRATIILLNSFMNFIWLPFSEVKQITSGGIGLFTYVGASKRNKKDTYFGFLIDYLSRLQSLPINYIFYVDRPYKAKKKIIDEEQHSHLLLYSFLKINDFFKIVKHFLNAIRKKYKIHEFKSCNESIDFTPILERNVIDEIGKGFVDNILVYYSMKTISKKKLFDSIVYPFENKSLEKLLLLGLGNRVKAIGYQHTSITPRHFTFLFTKEELRVTPIPSKIITLGGVTADWLINNGNLPSNNIREGFSLRHNLEKQFKKNGFNPNFAKLLFAFSSGFHEIVNTVKFLDKILIDTLHLQCRFRMHPSYPLNKLDDITQKWISKNVTVSVGTNLLEDLEWADITVYISSTVALEAMYAGVPVIHLDIDTLNSDPLLVENLDYKWTCNEPCLFFKTIQIISSLTSQDRSLKAFNANSYVSRYLQKNDSESSFLMFVN